jgi:hypothetical protein
MGRQSRIGAVKNHWHMVVSIGIDLKALMQLIAKRLRASCNSPPDPLRANNSGLGGMSTASGSSNKGRTAAAERNAREK